MFGLGMGELIVILAIALIFLGPKRLPDVATTLGKAIRSFRKATRDLTDQLEIDDEVKKPLRELQSALMARPLIAAWKEAATAGVAVGKPEMVYTSPVEGFMVLFKLAMLVGVFLASPFVFREIWRFISPGLYDRERK